MNKIKSDWCSCLKTDTTERLIHISIDGVPLINFDPFYTIQEWWVDSTRSHRYHVSKHAATSDSS